MIPSCPCATAASNHARPGLIDATRYVEACSTMRPLNRREARAREGVRICIEWGGDILCALYPPIELLDQ